MSVTAQQRRARQTVRNLILSLLATIGVTLLIVLGVPRDDSNRITEVDYQQIATEAETSLGIELLVPQIPEGWWSNAARLDRELGVDVWYLGFVTGENQYIGLSYAWESNPSWEALTLQGNWFEDELQIGARKWEIWPTLTPSSPPGSKENALLLKLDGGAVVIYGTAPLEDLITLAEAIDGDLR